jgi:hypothetical protein
MAKVKFCPADRWTHVIKNFGTGMPRTFEISTDEAISGTYEEKPYFWIFAQAPRTGPLSRHMTFRRKWINGIYRVRFRPDTDVTVRIR